MWFHRRAAYRIRMCMRHGMHCHACSQIRIPKGATPQRLQHQADKVIRTFTSANSVVLKGEHTRLSPHSIDDFIVQLAASRMTSLRLQELLLSSNLAIATLCKLPQTYVFDQGLTMLHARCASCIQDVQNVIDVLSIMSLPECHDGFDLHGMHARHGRRGDCTQQVEQLGAH